MKSLFLIFASMMLAFSGDADKTTWQLDGGHSSLRFSVKHQGVANFNGNFERFEVTVKTNGDDFATMEVDMSAEVSSLNTSNDMRDKHLLAPDFFDAEKFPKMTFKSKSVKKKGKGYAVSGDFTMHGVTKTVELTAVHNATVVVEHDGQKMSIAGFKVTGMVKRSDFGVAPSFKGVADEVYLDADLEVFKAPAEK